jgi:CheY-like chemotaxis protein
MDDETRSRMFEPFFTTKGAAGSGLGLATVYGIVAQSGGQIEVESAPERGTTVRIYLPRAAGAPEVRTPTELAASAGGSETVLVAEDNHVLQRLIARLLEERGYTVLAASSGPEALQALEAHGARIDLLLTDTVMPGMSGRELAAEFSRRCPGAPVLFMSGYAADVFAEDDALTPRIPLLEKPFTAAALLRSVREALERRERQEP